MSIKVSIITPCLNTENTIHKTIESVLGQTYRNIEYIIVDGGSTDGTLDIIREYESQFQGRMKYVSEKDRGIYDAMNKGIRLSHGELIGIINSDDWYENDAVEKIISVWNQETKYQVIYGYCRVLENGRIKNIARERHEGLTIRMIPHPTCFVTRAVYRDFGMFLRFFHVSADYELMLRLYTGKQVAFIQVKDILANFRRGGVSCISKRTEREYYLIHYRYGLISFKNMLWALIELYM